MEISMGGVYASQHNQSFCDCALSECCSSEMPCTSRNLEAEDDLQRRHDSNMLDFEAMKIAKLASRGLQCSRTQNGSSENENSTRRKRFQKQYSLTCDSDNFELDEISSNLLDAGREKLQSENRTSRNSHEKLLTSLPDDDSHLFKYPGNIRGIKRKRIIDPSASNGSSKNCHSNAVPRSGKSINRQKRNFLKKIGRQDTNTSNLDDVEDSEEVADLKELKRFLDNN